ncbi:MAG: hypothetical protein U5O69_01740 [Candidatus Competibacteraceae bacterium]|nr:hypothetical protein [Candidatus Competibacteraceae bacterium]
MQGDAIEIFQADHTQQVTGSSYVKAQGVVIESLSGITLKCGGTSLVLGPEGITLKGALLTPTAGWSRSPPVPVRRRWPARPATR